MESFKFLLLPILDARQGEKAYYGDIVSLGLVWLGLVDGNPQEFFIAANKFGKILGFSRRGGGRPPKA